MRDLCLLKAISEGKNEIDRKKRGSVLVVDPRESTVQRPYSEQKVEESRGKMLSNPAPMLTARQRGQKKAKIKHC